MKEWIEEEIIKLITNHSLRMMIISKEEFTLNQPIELHDWCSKGRGICNSVCGMVHIKEPLLLIGKSSRCGILGFFSHYMSDTI